MKKSRKSKIVLLSVLGLATVSLATVGFASWVISDITPATEQNIAVSAGTVTDSSLTAEILSGADLTVAFENKNKGVNFVNGETDKAEDLEFGFRVKVTGKKAALGGIKIQFTPSADFEKLTGSTTTETTADDYIIMPYSEKVVTVNIKEAAANQVLANEGAVTVSSSADTETTYTCLFKFAWGKAFLNVNPTNTPIGDSDTTTALTKSTLIDRLKDFKKNFPTATEDTPLMSVLVTPVAASN